MDTFEKGFAFAWQHALRAADGIKVTATAEQKRCLLAFEMYGQPKGTVFENLIIPLGGNAKQ